MAGTDIDQHSLDYARKNVDANELSKRIKLASSTIDSPLIPQDKLGVDELDFVMTNPPFYASRKDLQDSYGSKIAPASAICTGSDNEMICHDGDVGFVSRMLAESLELRDRLQWYTAMLGKLSSLQQIVAKLKEHEINNFAVTCLQAGHQTRRWAIGWSFRDLRPKNDVARHGSLVHAVLPSPTAQTIAVPLMSAAWAGKKIDMTLSVLDGRWKWRPAIVTGVLEVSENVWSRAARRKKKFSTPAADTRTHRADVHMTGDVEPGASEADMSTALAVKVSCREEEVEIRWLRGTDHVLFTSFCGMLKRALTSREA